MDRKGCIFVLFCVVFAATGSVFGDRMITIKERTCQNSSSCNNQVIYHVVAQDNTSTIHYLWTTYPVPTIVIAYTTVENVSLEIDWKSLLVNHTGIQFQPGVNFTFGFALTRLYEFEDPHDKADINDHGAMVVHKLAENTVWDVELNNSTNKVTFTGNKTIIFDCIASTSQGRESSLPHNLHTADSSRFSLTLNNASVKTNKTRFAYEVMYIVPDQDKPSVSVHKSIDDEYTPAVFETVYGKIHSKKHNAYSQWKPIAYDKSDLGRKYQTRASAGDLSISENRSWNIAEMLVGNGKYSLNITFGLSKDGFYQKNKYLTWSGYLGYGEPATSSLSFLVILIISIGLGLPLAIIVFGGTYVQIRKYCCKTKVPTSYSRIN